MVIVGCFAVNNLTFGVWRVKAHHPPPPPPQHLSYMHPPTQQQIGFQTSHEGFYTPYQNHAGMQGMDQGRHGLETQSPTKKLEYR